MVQDNRRGFNAFRVALGEGMSNMKERLAAVQGRAEIAGRPEGEAIVMLCANLNKLAEAA
jgi:signal transduction histidine kinase